MTASKPVAVTVLGKEYLVACEEHERERLTAVVELISNRLQQLKNRGNIIGTERMAVMVLLNVAGELLEYRRQNQDYNVSMERINTKINHVLAADERRAET